MSERLRLTLDEGKTSRDKIEKAVKSLGYGIAPRAANAGKDFVLPDVGAGKDHGDEHVGHDHSEHDHKGHDHGQATATAKRDDGGHGSPGHVHDDPADRGKRWYQTGKGNQIDTKDPLKLPALYRKFELCPHTVCSC